MADPIDILKIIVWLDKHNVKNYDIKKDGRVDVLGSVRLFNKKLKEISIQFGEIKGDFDCSNNELILLKGCPQKITVYLALNFFDSFQGLKSWIFATIKQYAYFFRTTFKRCQFVIRTIEISRDFLRTTFK